MELTYTMPTNGLTRSGDEYLNQVTREWHSVPPESIGQMIDGAIIRRPVVYEPSDTARELDETVRELEKTVTMFGLRFAKMRGGYSPANISEDARKEKV